jgi:hypothetical protein
MPSGGGTRSTEVTFDPAGPRLANDSSVESLEDSPLAATSTPPEGVFLTQPETPSSNALSRTNHRNPTPCTLPTILRWMTAMCERG